MPGNLNWSQRILPYRRISMKSIWRCSRVLRKPFQNIRNLKLVWFTWKIDWTRHVNKSYFRKMSWPSVKRKSNWYRILQSSWRSVDLRMQVCQKRINLWQLTWLLVKKPNSLTTSKIMFSQIIWPFVKQIWITVKIKLPNIREIWKKLPIKTSN